MVKTTSSVAPANQRLGNRGEKHYATKRTGMTDEKVREIRKLVQNGCPFCGKSLTYREIGSLYRISNVMVYFIASGKKWKHVV